MNICRNMAAEMFEKPSLIGFCITKTPICKTILLMCISRVSHLLHCICRLYYIFNNTNCSALFSSQLAFYEAAYFLKALWMTVSSIHQLLWWRSHSLTMDRCWKLLCLSSNETQAYWWLKRCFVDSLCSLLSALVHTSGSSTLPIPWNSHQSPAD